MLEPHNITLQLTNEAASLSHKSYWSRRLEGDNVPQHKHTSEPQLLIPDLKELSKLGLLTPEVVGSKRLSCPWLGLTILNPQPWHQ